MNRPRTSWSKRDRFNTDPGECRNLRVSELELVPIASSTTEPLCTKFRQLADVGSNLDDLSQEVQMRIQYYHAEMWEFWQCGVEATGHQDEKLRFLLSDLFSAIVV